MARWKSQANWSETSWLDGWQTMTDLYNKELHWKLIYGNWNHLFTCGLVVLSLITPFYRKGIQTKLLHKAHEIPGNPYGARQQPITGFRPGAHEGWHQHTLRIPKTCAKHVNWLCSMWQDVVFLTWNMLVYMKSRWWAITILLKLEVFSS